MRNIGKIQKRLAAIEAKQPARQARWFSPDRDGALPDDFNPERDNLIYHSIVTPGTMEREEPAMTWRGKPFNPDDYPAKINIQIGGDHEHG